MNQSSYLRIRGGVRSRDRRIVALVVLAAALVGGGFAARSAGETTPPVRLAPVSVASEVAPAGAQSSAWYCTGGSGPLNTIAESTLSIVNSGRSPVTGTLQVFDDRGATKTVPITVGPGSELTEVPGSIVAGEWLGSKIEVQGGAVSVSNTVTGPAGWAVTPCATVTSSSWYFASGSTATGNSLYISVFNPTTTMAVIDLAFVTASGRSEPVPFEGLVIPPGGVVTAEVAELVQNAPAIATVVTALSGRVVAAELQVWGASSVSGLSLRLGAPATSARWLLPGAVDAQGGASQLAVFNPTPRPQKVEVSIRIPSGVLSPFTQDVGPDSVWTLPTAQQIRIPSGTPYALDVTSTGGQGVIVDRSGSAAPSAPGPQWGAVVAVPAAASGTGRWLVPRVVTGTSGTHTALMVAVQNTSSRRVTIRVLSVGRSGAQPIDGLDAITLAPHTSSIVGATSLRDAASSSLEVRSTGPVSVMGYATANAVIAVPAVPLR